MLEPHFLPSVSDFLNRLKESRFHAAYLSQKLCELCGTSLLHRLPAEVWPSRTRGRGVEGVSSTRGAF